jgi:hypothetical protein
MEKTAGNNCTNFEESTIFPFSEVDFSNPMGSKPNALAASL